MRFYREVYEWGSRHTGCSGVPTRQIVAGVVSVVCYKCKSCWLSDGDQYEGSEAAHQIALSSPRHLRIVA